MTVTEAAKKIGISGSKMYQLLAARKISFFRVDGKIIVMQADIDAYLACCRVPAAVAPATAAPRVPIRLKHLKLS